MSTTESRQKSWGFPVLFDRYYGGVSAVGGAEDIATSLSILLSTVPGERIMLPSYGCDLGALAFSRINKNLETLMVGNIRTSIVRFEPRVEVLDIALKEEYEEGKIHIHIAYRIKATGVQASYVHLYSLDGLPA